MDSTKYSVRKVLKHSGTLCRLHFATWSVRHENRVLFHAQVYYRESFLSSLQGKITESSYSLNLKCNIIVCIGNATQRQLLLLYTN